MSQYGTIEFILTTTTLTNVSIKGGFHVRRMRWFSTHPSPISVHPSPLLGKFLRHTIYIIWLRCGGSDGKSIPSCCCCRNIIDRHTMTGRAALLFSSSGCTWSNTLIHPPLTHIPLYILQRGHEYEFAKDICGELHEGRWWNESSRSRIYTQFYVFWFLCFHISSKYMLIFLCAFKNKKDECVCLTLWLSEYVCLCPLYGFMMVFEVCACTLEK